MTTGVALPPGSRSDHRTEERTALTPRQLEVLRLLGTGMRRDDAANQLGISRRTVNALMGDAFRRLDVMTLVEALIVMGWLEVPRE